MVGRRRIYLNQELSKEELAKLEVIKVPNDLFGDITKFKNLDPSRILHYEVKNNELLLYMKEVHRLEAIEEFKSTIEAFQFEVEQGISPEVEVFYSFEFDRDFTKFMMTVDQLQFEQDITAEMIELTLVEDALKYQIYNRKPVGVNVYYRDKQSKEMFKKRVYPIR